MARKKRYAKGPLVYLYDLETRRKKQWQMLWGDWLWIGDDIDDEWSTVLWGGGKRYAIRKSDYQKERVLQMIFLDVGQGDGCILTTPKASAQDQMIVIDAGVSDNMERFLEWRLHGFEREFKFHAAVVTHPDSDHYVGFQRIFEQETLSFENVYHNGLMERTGDDLLGPVEDGFLTDIRSSKTAARDLYSDPEVRGRKYYPRLMWTALQSDRCDNIAMLSTEHGRKEDGRTWMPGFAPSESQDLTIEVLGPVVERAPNGKRGLRTFGKTVTSKAMDKGKTKNGHSVLLRLQYRDFSVLFGGDLNTPAEHFLMRHYGNDGEAPSTIADTKAMIEKARARFGVDLMKCCHHGSSDVTDEFLEATEPAAYVVSSGDEESHVHPRPDLLGLLGKKGRGERPLVLCTEVLRSTREGEDPDLRGKLDRLLKKIVKEDDEEDLKEHHQKRNEILDELFERNVSAYGAINLRTDGHHAVIAFRNEKGSPHKRWFAYELAKDSHGVFQVQDRDGH